MKVFGVAGHSGMGKTTLLERLVPELRSRGLAVSLIKHSHKDIDIDRPGKDSYRLREAGCSEVLLLGDKRWALMHELRAEAEPSLDYLLDRMQQPARSNGGLNRRRPLQCGNQRATNFAFRCPAQFDQAREGIFHSVQVRQLGSDVGDFGFGLLPRLRAARSVLQLEEIGDLIEAEAQALGAPDETQPGQVLFPVASDAPTQAIRLEHQAPALIEADGLDIDICRVGQAANGQALIWNRHGT